MKKKVCIVFNHFQFQDGVARAAIAVANTLVKQSDADVTLIPLFKFKKDALNLIDERVKVKPFLKFYFRGLQKLVDIIPYKMLYKLVVREKYDIEIGFCLRLPIQIIANSTNSDAAHYAWMHGYDNGLTLKEYYQKVDKLICVSRENAERVAREACGSINVDYSYNPLDDLAVIEQGQVPVGVQKSEEMTFVTVGRQSEEKGFARLIDVVKRLKEDGFNLKLWFVGDGPEHSALVDKVNAYGLEEDVTFWGTQKNPHAYTSKADVFVCSSYTEGYSTACTEAVILEVPVITTAVGGAKEIIEDSEAGLMVENSDEALYEGMKFALCNPDKVNEWKQTLKDTRIKFSHVERSKKLIGLLNLHEEVKK